MQKTASYRVLERLCQNGMDKTAGGRWDALLKKLIRYPQEVAWDATMGPIAAASGAVYAPVNLLRGRLKGFNKARWQKAKNLIKQDGLYGLFEAGDKMLPGTGNLAGGLYMTGRAALPFAGAYAGIKGGQYLGNKIKQSRARKKEQQVQPVIKQAGLLDGVYDLNEFKDANANAKRHYADWKAKLQALKPENVSATAAQMAMGHGGPRLKGQKFVDAVTAEVPRARREALSAAYKAQAFKNDAEAIKIRRGRYFIENHPLFNSIRKYLKSKGM